MHTFRLALVLASAALTALKLTAAPALPWWFVTAPLWLLGAVYALVLALFGFLVLVAFRDPRA